MEAPDIALQLVKHYFTASYFCLGVGYALKGKWMAHKIVLRSKVPYTDALKAHSSVIGAANMLLASNQLLADHKSPRARCVMALGHALFAAVLASKYRILGRVARSAIAVHGVAALFWSVVKPKTRKVADEPAAAPTTPKSYRL